MKKLTLPSAVLAVAVLSVLFLVLYTRSFLYPQITMTVDNLLIEETSRSANALANHLQPISEPLRQEQLPQHFLSSAKNFLWEFNAQKIRLYSASGEIIYSSRPSEIGNKNKYPYFQDIIATGSPLTRMVEKEEHTAEGILTLSDTVEVYIPLMRGTEFLGALEVYNDVSMQKGRLTHLLNLSTKIVLLATGLLLLALGIVFWRDLRNRKAQKQVEDNLLIEESERKYRDIFENAMDSIFILDDQFRYVDVNPIATETFGYTRDEFLKMSVFDIIPVDQAPRSEEEFALLKERGSYKNFIGQIRTKDGRWRDVEVNSSVILKDGKMAGSRDIVRDITLRKKMEDDIARARNLDALGILAGGIAHDFNNLMTAILGNISLAMVLPSSGADHKKLLGIAEEAIMRAKDLTQQLLTFSQGGLPQKKVSSLEKLIKSSAAFPLTGSNIKCEFNLADDLMPALVDNSQIGQVIQNLVLNAREAMPLGGHIMISGENIRLPADNESRLPEGLYVRLTIIDTGMGIEEKILPQIFDPYFSTKERDKRKGMGLGLSICHSIIDNHQGSIEVESTYGQGTRFQILLPGTTEPVKEEVQADYSALKKTLNILLMDDEEIIREVATQLLEFDGHEVTCVEDGDKALTAYRQALKTERPFDLVILDLTIPGGIGGLETLQRLTAIDPDVTALVSSGHSKNQVSLDSTSHGFKGSLAKPYSIQKLRQELERLFPAN